MADIINKVADSKIISFDMEEILPKETELMHFDLAPYLFQGLVLREKEFRQALKELDWAAYQNKIVWVSCTADAIIPIWAYMLVASYLQHIALHFAHSKEHLYLAILGESVKKITADATIIERPVVIKGCSNIPFKESLYLEACKLFLPYAKSIMYGEPCSTVPIYKSGAVLKRDSANKTD